MSLPIPNLTQWLEEARSVAQQGHLPTYIPLMGQKDPSALALAYLDCQGGEYLNGDTALSIPLMSLMKPFLLLYLLTELGDEVWAQVGSSPSSYPFNSLEQLQLDKGFPRNPFLNSGAIALSGSLPEPRHLATWLNQLALTQLHLDAQMLASVESSPNPHNLAIAQCLHDNGYLAHPTQALTTYNYLCCLAGTVKDVARLGLLLWQSPPPLLSAHCAQVRELMASCGLYQASLGFPFPCKSAVSGLILALKDGGAIAVYSPPLDSQGNSQAGLFLLKKVFSTEH